MASEPTPGKTAGPQDRRSTRLSIAIPIIITGKDARGEPFRENAHTLVVNAHGAKITTFHRLNLGAEIRIENPTLVRSVRACVVWLGKKPNLNGAFEVGVQLLQAQNIWGIQFPPDDWQDRSSAAEPRVRADGGEQTDVAAADALLHRFNQLAAEAVERHSVLFAERLAKVVAQLSAEAQTRLQEEARLLQEKTIRTMERDVYTLTSRLQSTYGKVGTLLTRSQETEKNGRTELARIQEKLKEITRQSLQTTLEEVRTRARKDLETLAEDFTRQLRQRLQQELTAKADATRRAPPPHQSLNDRADLGNREVRQIPPPKSAKK